MYSLLSFIFLAVPLLHGRSFPDLRIMGGTNVDISEFPYQLSMHYKDNLLCGAVLIRDRLAVTAAHCVEDEQNRLLPTERLLVLGGSSYQGNGTRFNIRQIIKHKFYNPKTLYNDIALLIFQSKVTISVRIQPVGLPLASIVIADGSAVNVSGWGYMKPSGPSSNVLQYVQLNIVGNVPCQTAYGGGSTITEEMICAASSQQGKDGCYGDSGGPLTRNGVLIGIVSWGRGCGKTRFPGVYTRISKYLDFLNYYMAI